jgi:hypothetical protein
VSRIQGFKGVNGVLQEDKSVSSMGSYQSSVTSNQI